MPRWRRRRIARLRRKGLDANGMPRHEMGLTITEVDHETKVITFGLRPTSELANDDKPIWNGPILGESSDN